MMNMTWDTPYKGEVKTLKLRRDPFRNGLGHYTDVDGRVWDVYALRGTSSIGPYVNARPVSQHPGYYSTGSTSTWPTGTASGGNGHGEMMHTWIPYRVELVEGAL